MEANTQQTTTPTNATVLPQDIVNASPEKHAGGRPPLWTDPMKLKDLVYQYFTGPGKDKPTLSGLALHLGMSRSSLYNYDQKDQFLDIIKEARQRVEMAYETRLIYDTQPTGVIFALKNMGWQDNSKQEIDHTTKGEKIHGFNYLPPVTSNDTNNQTNTETT